MLDGPPKPGSYDFKKLEIRKLTAALIENIQGPFVEIGGPTPPFDDTEDPYEMVDIVGLPIITTNILPVPLAQPANNENGFEFIGELRPDVFADGCKLPFGTGAIAIVFVSAMAVPVRAKIFEESSRVLKPEGLLFWQWGAPNEKKIAEANGLTLLAEFPQLVYLSACHFLFQKRDKE